MSIEIRQDDMARHPVVLALVAALAISAGFQATKGPTPGSTLSHTGHLAIVALSSIYIVCALLIWTSAVIHNKKRSLALNLELSGDLGIGISFIAFAGLLITRVPDWYTTPTVWIFVGLAVGFMARAGQVFLAMREIIKLTKFLEEFARRKESGEL